MFGRRYVPKQLPSQPIARTKEKLSTDVTITKLSDDDPRVRELRQRVAETLARNPGASQLVMSAPTDRPDRVPRGAFTPKLGDTRRVQTSKTETRKLVEEARTDTF